MKKRQLNKKGLRIFSIATGVLGFFTIGNHYLGSLVVKYPSIAFLNAQDIEGQHLWVLGFLLTVEIIAVILMLLALVGIACCIFDWLFPLKDNLK